MQYTELGNTGLTVSVAGLGCGGNSRIGLGAGLTTSQSVALVREAFDLGVTLFDTAEAYGTEDILGRAFSAADRGKVVISTKSRILRGKERLGPSEVVANLDLITHVFPLFDAEGFEIAAKVDVSSHIFTCRRQRLDRANNVADVAETQG